MKRVEKDCDIGTVGKYLCTYMTRVSRVLDAGSTIPAKIRLYFWRSHNILAGDGSPKLTSDINMIKPFAFHNQPLVCIGIAFSATKTLL